MSGSLGVTFASLGSLGLQGGLEIARSAEALGYDSYWTAETTGADSFSMLMAVHGAAPRLGLGTGIIPIQLRTPGLAAMCAATLQAFSPNCDVLLGVGVSSPVVTAQWHGVDYGNRPIAQMREYLTLVREMLTGEQVTFDGDFYHVKRFKLGVRLGERRPKLVLAALNERMLRLGGELADGVLLNYIPASHVPWAVSQVRHGGDATIYAYVHAGVVEDRERGYELARKDLYSYAVVDGYAKQFSAAGFADDVAEMKARLAAGDRNGAPSAISNAMVDAIDFMGDAREVRTFFDTYRAAGVDHPVLMALPWGRDRMAVAQATLAAAAGVA